MSPKTERKNVPAFRDYETTLSGENGDSSVLDEDDICRIGETLAAFSNHNCMQPVNSRHRPSLMAKVRTNESCSSLNSSITLDSDLLDESFSNSSSSFQAGTRSSLFRLSSPLSSKQSERLVCPKLEERQLDSYDNKLCFSPSTNHFEDELNSSDRFKSFAKKSAVTSYYSVSLPVRKPIRSGSTGEKRHRDPARQPHRRESAPISSSALPKQPTREEPPRGGWKSDNRRLLRRGRRVSMPDKAHDPSNSMSPLMPRRRCSAKIPL